MLRAPLVLRSYTATKRVRPHCATLTPSGNRIAGTNGTSCALHLCMRHVANTNNGAADSSSSSPGTASSSGASQHDKAIPPSHGHQEALPPPPQPGLFSMIREEIGKLFRYVAHDVSKTAEASADSVKKYKDKMTDAHLSEEEKEKRRKKTEAYQKIMQMNAAKAKAEADAKTANMTWKEKLKYTLQQMKQATSPQQGVAALVQHCAAAHQAEVAVEQGIDVEDIQIVLEQVKKADGIGYETKVVGYIDAPKASEEQVYAYAERLKQKCPAANMMQASMEWRKKGGSGGEASPGTLSGRNFMRNTSAQSDESEEVFGGGGETAGPSAAAFPSSFKNRKSASIHSSPVFKDDKDFYAKIKNKSSSASFGSTGFDNPFERLKILREDDTSGKEAANPNPSPTDSSFQSAPASAHTKSSEPEKRSPAMGPKYNISADDTASKEK